MATRTSGSEVRVGKRTARNGRHRARPLPYPAKVWCNGHERAKRQAEAGRCRVHPRSAVASTRAFPGLLWDARAAAFQLWALVTLAGSADCDLD